MGATTEEAGRRPSACIRVDLGAQLRPLFCTSLASGGRLWVVKRPLQRAPRGVLERGVDLELTPWGQAPKELAIAHRPASRGT